MTTRPIGWCPPLPRPYRPPWPPHLHKQRTLVFFGTFLPRSSSTMNLRSCFRPLHPFPTTQTCLCPASRRIDRAELPLRTAADYSAAAACRPLQSRYLPGGAPVHRSFLFGPGSNRHKCGTPATTLATSTTATLDRSLAEFFWLVLSRAGFLDSHPFPQKLFELPTNNWIFLPSSRVLPTATFGRL